MTEAPFVSSLNVQPRNRKFYLLIGAFVLCAVLVGVFSARRGKSSVEKWKDEMRAKGEKFTLAELIPKRTGLVTNRMDELVRLGQLLSTHNASIGSLEHVRYLSNGVAEATWALTNLGATMGVGATRSKGFPAAIVAYEWDALAADIGAVEAPLEDVHALLRVRDRDLAWDYEFKTPMPKCFSSKRTIAQWLAAANTHYLHAREPDRAFTNITALFELTAWHDEDFTWMGQMIRMGIGGLALHSSWAALQAPGFTEAQLASLQTQLQTNAVLPSLVRTLEIERASMDQVFVRLRTGQETFDSVFGGTFTLVKWGGLGEPAARALWRSFLGGADELFYLRNLQGQLVALRDLVRLRDWSAVQSLLAANRAERAIFDTWNGNLLMISRFGIPDFILAMQNAVRFETRRELTLVAIALERHRRKHGMHPATLDQLVPEFLSAVPVDWMDGKALRYRLNPDGTYTLWSVGEDFKDDGGDATDVSKSSGRRDIWDGRDAVWPRMLVPAPVK